MAGRLSSVIELLVLPEFLDRPTRRAVVDALRASDGTPATVYGADAEAAVRAAIRNATHVQVSGGVRDAIAARLESVRPEIGRHFGVPLTVAEEPQFLRYAPGGYFVAHQDGNTPLIRDDTRHRRISVVLFLNERSEDPLEGAYGGGELLFHGAYPDWLARQSAPADPGTLVAFRSETTHEVTPVTHGERYTVVSWYR